MENMDPPPKTSVFSGDFHQQSCFLGEPQLGRKVPLTMQHGTCANLCSLFLGFIFSRKKAWIRDM